MSRDVEVRGGRHSVSVQVDSLWDIARALDRAADDLHEAALVAARAVADPAVAVMALAGLPAAPVWVAGAACAGPAGPSAVAVRLSALAGAVRTAALAYRHADLAVTAALGAAGAIGLVTGAWVRPALTLGAVAVGAAAPGPWREPSRAILASRPGAVVVGLHVRVLGAVTAPAGVPAVASGVARTSGTAGLLTEGPVHAGAAPPVRVRPAGDLADLLRQTEAVSRRTPGPPPGTAAVPGGPTGAVVRVVQVRRPGPAGHQVAWVVHIPGTQRGPGRTRPGQSPFDLAGDVHLMAGHRTAGTEAVSSAMSAAGIPPGDPVLLVGHSQGGMIAAALAADPALRSRYAITHVVTAGSPIAGVPVRPGVQVLSLEHRDDLVPRLDGHPNPQREEWVTVSADCPAPAGGSLPPHDSGGYVVTAARLAASTDPDVIAFQQGLRPFLDGPGVQARAVDVAVTRR
jgi:hypothetical protein